MVKCDSVDLCKAVLGGNERLTYERRLLDALFLTNWNLANYGIVVLNLATVDVPGVIISRPMVCCIGVFCIERCKYACIYFPMG